MACSNHGPSTSEIANPVAIGDVILDGDEDAQVVVYEDGAPTWWALQQRKWRMYFHIPSDLPSEVVGYVSSRMPEEPEPLQLVEEAGCETN